MARGHEEGRGRDDSSSKRLICSGDVIGPGVDEDDAKDFHPNIVVFGDLEDGNPDNMRVGGTGISGTGDFSIEAWICRNYPDSITNWGSTSGSTRGYGLTGWLGEGVSPQIYAGFWFRGANFEGMFSGDGTANQVTITGVLPFGWCHVALTCDRDGNMTLYVNGISQGASSISASSAVAATWSGPGVLYCDYANADTNSMKTHPPYRVAALAYHNALLSGAQVQDSVDKISLQDLSTTSGRYFFSNTELLPDASTTDDCGTFYWTEPYDAPTLVNTGGSTGGTAATTTVFADMLSELPANIDLAMLQESLYLTTIDGSMKDNGARTVGSDTASTIQHTPWYSHIFAEGTANLDEQIVFGNDPTWPPTVVGEKGYA